MMSVLREVVEEEMIRMASTPPISGVVAHFMLASSMNTDLGRR